jgi:pyruvate kinase
MDMTKIVATIGPACDTEEKLAELLKAGMNVARFNMKHGTVAWHNERINRLQNLADQMGLPVGILIDLQGPEIRIETPDQQSLPVQRDEVIWLTQEFIPGRKGIRVADQRVIEALNPGDEVLIDDGFNEFDVVGKTPEGLQIKARKDYQIGHRKGMNLPKVRLDLHSLIQADLEKLDMASQNKVDFVALSFVRSAEDIAVLREEMKKRNVTAQVVAKIENAHAIENLEAIIAASDAVMVARGDLGVEVPFEELSYWQKTMIYKCRQAGKPVITATQMLQSMVDAPRPTRAEVSDVANAVFDGSDAIMLSGETAQGHYPIEAISAMRKIARFNETKAVLPELHIGHDLNQTEAVAEAAFTLLTTERDFAIAALVVFTETGTTVRKLARLHPNLPIIALTENAQVRDQLCLTYGVMPLLMSFPDGDIISVDPIMAELTQRGIVQKGDRLLFVHGNHWKQPGLTNTLSVKEVL